MCACVRACVRVCASMHVCACASKGRKGNKGRDHKIDTNHLSISIPLYKICSCMQVGLQWMCVLYIHIRECVDQYSRDVL